MRQIEFENQCALFRWSALNAKKYPELKLLHASANGGKRNLIVAVKLKRSGVKAGVPDIFLPVPRGTFHGLWIELKAKNGRLSVSQAWWLAALQAQNYRAEVCYGWEEAKFTIEEYLKGGKKSSTNNCLNDKIDSVTYA